MNVNWTLREIAREHGDRLHAELLFGDEVKGLPIDEVRAKVAGFYNEIWRQKGGKGEHPMSPRVAS